MNIAPAPSGSWCSNLRITAESPVNRRANSVASDTRSSHAACTMRNTIGRHRDANGSPCEGFAIEVVQRLRAEHVAKVLNRLMRQRRVFASLLAV